MMVKKEMNVAIEAALKGGVEIMEVYQGDFDFELKDDNSPLTVADQKANAVITSLLETTDIPIISEENKQLAYSERKNWKQCWIVDPLDGTKEFIKRNGEFTVNIALVEDGVPVFGVIYVPVQQRLYFGFVQSKLAFKCEVSDEQEAIDTIIAQASQISNNTNTSETIRVVGSRSHMNKETEDFIEALTKKGKQVEVVASGSSLKFCLVAEGKADVYPRYAPTMEWDTAAAHAICNAAGISVRNVETNQELRYNKENLLNPWFICE